MSSLHRQLMKSKFEDSRSSASSSSANNMPPHQDKEPHATTMAINAPSPEPTTGYWSDSSVSSSSPIVRQHNWPSPTSSEDEDEDDNEGDFDWDAGITDFALYSSDRETSNAAGQPLDTKWASFVSRQADALQRTMLRRRRSDSSLRSHVTDDEIVGQSTEAVPALTPDASPELRDNIDDDEQPYYQHTPHFSVPAGAVKEHRAQGYISVVVEPPARLFSALDYDSHADDDDIFDDDDDDEDEDEDEPPLEFYIQRHVQGRRHRKVQRPGLWGSRTLSGKPHSWRRPSWYLHPVIEEREE